MAKTSTGNELSLPGNTWLLGRRGTSPGSLGRKKMGSSVGNHWSLLDREPVRPAFKDRHCGLRGLCLLVPSTDARDDHRLISPDPKTLWRE